MSVTSIVCPKCRSSLKVATPPVPGKKVRCPRCDGVFVVPEPEVEEVEEVEEFEAVEEVESRSSRKSSGRSERFVEEREDEPVARKSSRQSRRDEEWDEEEPEERRRKKPKKARKGGSGVLLPILLGVGGLLVLVGGGFGIYYLATTASKSPALRALEEAASLFATVTDQKSAEAARPGLLAVAGRLRAEHEKAMTALKNVKIDAQDIQNAIDKAQRDPEWARAENEKRMKQMEKDKEAARKLMTEIGRVSKVPGGKDLVTAFFDAWGEGGSPFRMGASLLDALGNPDTGKTKAAPVIGSPSAQSYQQVQIGMSRSDVIRLMGGPPKMKLNSRGSAEFNYPGIGTITFKNKKVTSKTP